MIKKLKKLLDKGTTFAALLTDLLKAFDCLPYDLIIAKLYTYGFSLDSWRLIDSCLSNRTQRTNINTSYSFWEEIKPNVSQSVIIEPIALNIFICDLFSILIKIEFASYVDDTS